MAARFSSTRPGTWLAVAGAAGVVTLVAQVLMYLVLLVLGFGSLRLLWMTLFVGGMFMALATAASIVSVAALIMALVLWWRQYQAARPAPGDPASRMEPHGRALVRIGAVCLGLGSLPFLLPLNSLLFELGWWLDGADLAMSLPILAFVLAAILLLWGLGLGAWGIALQAKGKARAASAADPAVPR